MRTEFRGTRLRDRKFRGEKSAKWMNLNRCISVSIDIDGKKLLVFEHLPRLGHYFSFFILTRLFNFILPNTQNGVVNE